MKCFMRGSQRQLYKEWLVILEKLTSSVRETAVSRHNGASIQGHFKPLDTTTLRYFRDLMWTLNQPPMITKDASLSDSCTSDCCCFSSRVGLERIQTERSVPKFLGSNQLTEKEFYLLFFRRLSIDLVGTLQIVKSWNRDVNTLFFFFIFSYNIGRQTFLD